MSNIYSWSINLCDHEGDVFDHCVLAHIGNDVILKFKTPDELQQLALDILRSMPELKANYADKNL